LGENGFVLVLAIIVGTMIMVAVGFLIERFLIRRMYKRELPEQLLLTFALILIIGDLIKLVWGVEDRAVYLPTEPLEILDTFVNPYYFTIIATGCAVAAGLWWFLQKTRYGKIVRAAVYSRDMVSALGIRIPVIYACVFALGVGIAAFAAGVFLPLMPMALGVDIDLIVQCFAVVVIGGFGSILGTFVASLIVGIVYSFSILLWPDGALAVVFLIVVAVLMWRPWGLFGTELRY
jgi:branched-subunit amino acid ABC-type transport system permease component